MPDAELDRHLAGCAGCAAHAVDLAALHRRVRVQPADAVPDLTAPILAAAPVRRAPWHPGDEPIGWARWALFVVAVTQLVLAAPGLVLGEAAAVTSAHAARELGAFEVALAVGFLVAAWQPARAWGLLPLALVLGAILAGTAVLDVVDGGTSAVAESPHLLEVAGVALLWRVTRDPSASGPPRGVRVRAA